MTLSREDLIATVYRHAWYAPILRALAKGPRRYVEIRTDLVELKGTSPGDGYISTQLKALTSLGLVERSATAQARHPGWALTEAGRTCLDIIQDIENPARSGVTNPSEADIQSDQRSPREAMDTSTPHPARRYNYWLGGKDNFAADRASGDLFEKVYPAVRTTARENRGFLQRAVGHLAGQARITQFLDIGTGLPTADNTHEVAQRANPHCRVAYVDNDPMVMTHARALLTTTPEGRTCYIEEDLRNPEKILNHPDVRATLDFDKPIGLILVAVLHFIKDDNEARDIVQRLLAALPAGSYLTASNFTLDFCTPEEVASYHLLVDRGQHDTYPRDLKTFTGFFDGAELVPPGIVAASEWRPTQPVGERPTPQEVAVYAGVGRKAG